MSVHMSWFTILKKRITRYCPPQQSLSTYSSPKRYLWDSRPNREEWRFLTLPGEEKDNVLYIKGLSDFIKSNGRFDTEGIGGTTYDYPRRTLMTFSFLEMIVQARTQLNSPEHRAERGKRHLPRRIKRMIITCPTAMSKMERESLICCAVKKTSVSSERSLYRTPGTALKDNKSTL